MLRGCGETDWLKGVHSGLVSLEYGRRLERRLVYRVLPFERLGSIPGSRDVAMLFQELLYIGLKNKGGESAA